MKQFGQNCLLRLPPEIAHSAGLNALKVATAIPGVSKLFNQTLHAPVDVMGITFKNPIGLAAGLDKNGDYIKALAHLGFGFIEIGTVTPKPQLGNPKPRLFRLTDDQAIINRMGFNNKGVDYLVEQVKSAQFSGVLGINIGKNKTTDNANAIDDYLICLKKVYGYASYVVVNISSPNTPGLRALQGQTYLSDLLSQLKQAQADLARQYQRYVPIAVKVAPDLSEEEINAMAAALIEYKLDGVIATNTTLQRFNCQHPNQTEAGGLSGKPLSKLSLQACKLWSAALGTHIPIIGVGGIYDEQSAKDRVDAGASLLQLYTSLIYQGPSVLPAVLRGYQRSIRRSC